MLPSSADHIRSTIEEQQRLLESLNCSLQTPSPAATAADSNTPLDDGTIHSVATSRQTGRNRLRRHDKRMSKQLIDAAEIGDLNGMEHCIQKNADLNYQSKKDPPDRNGMAAIHMAAVNGHLSAVEILVSRGANVNLIEPLHQNTALHLAATGGYSDLVRYLVRSRANINVRDSLGQTPLLTATSEAIQIILLEAGADPNRRGLDAATALHYAAYFGFLDAVRLLVSQGADVDARNKEEQTPLWVACSNTHIPEEKSVAIAKILLQSSASPNAVSKVGGRTPFDEAICQNRPKVVRLLLEKGADILARPPDNLYPLHRVARDGFELVLKELVPYYESINFREPDTNYTALHFATLGGHESCVKFLLTKNAGLQSAGKDGFAPLHHAFRLSSTQISEIIIKEHISRNISIGLLDTISKRLPIHMASTAEIVELWVRYKGMVNWRDTNNQPILHHAVCHSNHAVVNALIKYGANLKLTDGHQNTAIEALCFEETVWETALEERLAVLQVLLKHVPLTEKCRMAISQWKNKQIRDRLSKQLPWRSLADVGALTSSFAMDNRVVLLAGAAVAGVLGARR